MSESLATTSGYWYARARTIVLALRLSIPWKISNVAAENREFDSPIAPDVSRKFLYTMAYK